MASETSNAINILAAEAHTFAVDVLVHSGVSQENAETVANSLVLADLRGVDTHGINRLPGYLERIKSGVLNPNPELSFVQKSPVFAHLDAQHTFGFVASTKAIDEAVSMAETFGVGIVGVKNSGHFGMAATYLLQAFERGYAAMVFTNSSRSMPAWGSKEALLGTSPFAVGLPGGKKGNFVLDMSPSVVARGKVRKAARRGEKIPEGWMLDGEGRNTTDPVEALKGVVLPIGGPKGSGLSMMMDIFGGLLTGASFAGGVNDQYHVLDRPQGVGHWFMVFKPEMFLDSRQDYEDRMGTLFDKVRNSEKAAGVGQIFTPGELEHIKQATQRERGIPFMPSEIQALNEMAEACGATARLRT